VFLKGFNAVAGVVQPLDRALLLPFDAVELVLDALLSHYFSLLGRSGPEDVARQMEKCFAKAFPQVPVTARWTGDGNASAVLLGGRQSQQSCLDILGGDVQIDVLGVLDD
jgi:hypothetical protein